ncbi:10221_t:CDS:2 [Entrophospora sp. SA101]|nr:18131_t:CDS:2 [Entrophospora sp. SA101]CAJ0836591.1 10221_t:CDS:2 [Entrophospora sp. SA101]
MVIASMGLLDCNLGTTVASELDHYNTVVMNESHERSLQTNVLIGLLRQGESDEALKLLDSEGSESVSNSVKQDLAQKLPHKNE